jgi:ribosomal protein S18 acetylase RimI-like enzyme
VTGLVDDEAMKSEGVMTSHAPGQTPAGSQPDVAGAAAAVTVRSLQPEDVDAVVDLSVRAWEPVFESFRQLLGPRLYARFYPDWRTQQASDVRAAIGKNITSVAVADGRVAGFVNVIIDNDEASGEIYMIAVDPNFQRRGIASMLTNWALDEMRGHGATVATVGTGADPGHAPARRTYEAAGFTPWPQVLYVQMLHED